MTHSRLFLEKCCKAFLSITPGKISYHKTLKACEKDTYDFIAKLESGKNVRIKKVSTGAGQLAEQKEAAEKAKQEKEAEEAEAAKRAEDEAEAEDDKSAEAQGAPKGGLQVQMDFDVNELLDTPDLNINVTKAEKEVKIIFCCHLSNVSYALVR